MNDNDDKTRLVRRPIQIQRSPEPPVIPAEAGEDDATRRIRGEDTAGYGGAPYRAADPTKTTLAFTPNRNQETTKFDPLAGSRPPVEDMSSDPVVGWLVVVGGPGRGNAVRLGYGWNSIGRDASQRVSLDFGDPKISRVNHGKLLYDPRGRKFTMTLGEGTNPIYVRGEVLMTPLEITNGDRIQIGDTELLFVALCGESFDWNDQA